jgi:ornithine decarboxylase
VYYAVKANADPEIIRTFYRAGAGFDVASLQELRIVCENIKDLPPGERQRWIWDKIIYANPIKAKETLVELDRYNPLVTYDNSEEIRKIRTYAPNAGLALRLRVDNAGAMVELSSKFGAAPEEALGLIREADRAGLTVEGLSFHVGSQMTHVAAYLRALRLAARVFKEARGLGYQSLRVLDIGGGFPAPYDASVKPFRDLAQILGHELDRQFPDDVEILAEPGRFLVATACTSVSTIIGKAVRQGKLCYYIDDGVYHTYSGVLFDHCHYPLKAFRTGPSTKCTVFGPTCDALDVVSRSEDLPGSLELGDLVYSENIGAYSHASSTSFNGFPPARIVHVNRFNPAQAPPEHPRQRRSMRRELRAPIKAREVPVESPLPASPGAVEARPIAAFPLGTREFGPKPAN